MAAVPARADAVTHFELLFVLVHGHNIPDNLVTGNLREARAKALIFDEDVAEGSLVNVTFQTKCSNHLSPPTYATSEHFDHNLMRFRILP